MKLISNSYEEIDRKLLAGREVVVRLSRELEDRCWDKFLEETPLGQFQQSSFWGRSKSAEGWTLLRVILTIDEEIVGGFQILWRRSWFGRNGYVSKGPVALSGYSGLVEYTTRLLRKIVR